MSQENEVTAPDVNTPDAQNEQGKSPEDKPLTPLDLVREQQAMQQKDFEVEQQRADPTADIPGGASPPSAIREHPQRQNR